MLGFALARLAPGECELLSIGVPRGHRRRGAGRQLLEAVAATARGAGARSLFLEVADDNAVAKRFYSNGGFAVVGRRRGYYRRRHGPALAAIQMRRDIRGEG